MDRTFVSRLPALIVSVGLGLLLAGCSGVAAEDLKHLQGYWEIREVQFPDGGAREYQGSSAIEYFELDPTSQKGYRKKLQPQLDGSFQTSDDALPMTCEFRGDRLFMQFPAEAEPWEEEILKLNPERLVTRHSNGLKYIYRRYSPIKLP